MSPTRKSPRLFELTNTGGLDILSNSGHSYVHAVDVQGRQVHVCCFKADNDGIRLEEPISVHSWSLNTTDNPVLEGVFDIETSEADLQLPIYSPNGPQTLRIVPVAAYPFKAAAIQLAANGLSVRIGSSVFPIISCEGLKEPLKALPGEQRYWEETTANAAVTVLCRRRKPKKETFSAGKLEVERVEKLKEMMAPRAIDRKSRNRRLYGSDSDSCSAKNAGVPYSDDMSIHSESSANGAFADNPSGGSHSDFENGDGEDADAASLSDASFSDSSPGNIRDLDSADDLIEPLETDPPENSMSGFSDDGDDYDSDTDSLRSADNYDSTDEEVDARDITEEGAPARTKIDDSELEGEGRVDYRVQHIQNIHSYDCDVCGGDLDDSFKCMLCEPLDSFELCEKCVNVEGQWCYDKTHKLDQIDQFQGLVRSLSWDPLSICQEIEVRGTCPTDNETSTALFHWEGSEYAILHESVPALHPTLPLVAWALQPGKLFLANYHTKSEFSQQTLKPSVHKAKQISIDLRFSACGLYLHVGTVEALRVRSKNAKDTTKKPKQYILSFHLCTLRLAADKPARRRAAVIARQSHDLGLWTTPVISVLPFSWTWQLHSVYLTMNSETLQLYQITFPTSTKQRDMDDVSRISALSNPAELPCSVRDRAVQFLPASGPEEKAMFVVGPGSGPDGGPPTVVYLSEEDLGPWVRLKNSAAAAKNSKKGLAPLPQSVDHDHGNSCDGMADDEK